MSLTAVVPAYNEAQRIGRVIAVLQRVPLVDEIIVVNDGSLDDTVEVARGCGAKVVDLGYNRGKGAAMAEGARRARGDYLLFLDADLDGLTKEHVVALVEPVLTGKADMSVGIFTGGRTMTDWAQVVTPCISGQRVISRQLFLEAGAECSRYDVEMILTRFARRRQLRVAKVPLCNMTHAMKEEKRGMKRGMVERVGMYKDITTCLIKMYRPRSPWRILKPTYLGVAILIGLLIFTYNLSYTRAAKAEAGRLLQLNLSGQARRILVISAHPDDEALAAAGLIAEGVRAGDLVEVVYVTSGDGFRRGMEMYRRQLRARPEDLLSYGKERMEEAVNAMGQLGLPRNRIIFLGYPDGGLGKILKGYRSQVQAYRSPNTGVDRVPYENALTPGAPYNAPAITADLERVLHQFQPTDIFIPDLEDSHPDHRASGSLALEAVAVWLNHDHQQNLHLYSYLIHAGFWQIVPSLRKNDMLLPPKRYLERGTWYNLTLTPQGWEQKKLALNQYVSQLKVIGSFMENFLRRNEIFYPINLNELKLSRQRELWKEEMNPTGDADQYQELQDNSHQWQGGRQVEPDRQEASFPSSSSPLRLVDANGGA